MTYSWTDLQIPEDLKKQAQNVMETTDEKYQALVKDLMDKMGIEDLGKASDDDVKKLFNKADELWNSDEEPGDDGVNTSETDMHPGEYEESTQHSDEVLSETEQERLERKAQELGLKRNSLNEELDNKTVAKEIHNTVQKLDFEEKFDMMLRFKKPKFEFKHAKSEEEARASFETLINGSKDYAKHIGQWIETYSEHLESKGVKVKNMRIDPDDIGIALPPQLQIQVTFDIKGGTKFRSQRGFEEFHLDNKQLSQHNNHMTGRWGKEKWVGYLSFPRPYSAKEITLQFNVGMPK